MGLLDDAIRQHLELKRQHGAPEEELKRQEEEALGPARRDVAPAEPPGEDGEVELEAVEEPAPGADETDLHEQEDEPLEEETVLQGPESDSDAEPFEAGPERDLDEDVQDLHEPSSPAPFDGASAFEDFDEEAEPEQEDQPEAAEGEGGDTDVLEDTPDFLQETPEHDRLWFEQKPPRDFDFD